MSDVVPWRPSTRSEAVLILGTIAMRRGGVTRMVLARIRCYAEAGIKVRLLLTGYRADEDHQEAAIREAWSLPDSVEIRYFWRDAAPGGGGAPVDARVSASEEPGLVATTESKSGATTVRFRDEHGLLVTAKRFTPQGRLVRVDRHEPGGPVVTREHFDADGRLVVRDGMDAGGKKPLVRRWYARSGECWLTTWLNGDGRPRQTVRHLPEPIGYHHFGQCVAEWIDRELANSPAPVVFSDTREQDAILLALRHETVRKVSVVHNGHTSQPYRSSDSTKSNYRPLLEHLSGIDTLVVLTERQRRDIAERYGGAELTVINHATPDVPEQAAQRDPNLLVAVARMERQKRLEDAIRGFARAAPKLPHARFDIYGGGSERTELGKLVAELGMTDRIRFRGFTEDALNVLAGATAMVFTSRFEGWGLVISEALAVGTPVVSYDINYGPAELIRHEVDGLLVDPGDLDGLAAALVRVLGDEDYAAKLSERAPEIRERFTTQRWRAEWLGLMKRLDEREPRWTVDVPAGRGTGERTAERASGRFLARMVSERSPRELSRAMSRWAYRRARRVARPSVRRFRAVRSVALLGAYLAGERMRGGTLAVLVCGSSHAAVTNVSRALRLAGRLGVPAEVLLLDHVPAATLRRMLAGTRPAVWRFWRDAAPDGGPPDPEIDIAGLTPGPVPGPGGSWEQGYYRDGDPVVSVAEGRGAGRTVHHYGHAGLPVRREEIDEHGGLVRVVDIDAGSGRDIEARYLDAGGGTWLSVQIGQDGKRKQLVQYRPSERRFPGFRAAQRHWAAGWLAAGHGRHSVLAVDRPGESVAEELGVRTLAVGRTGVARLLR